jgi:diacylglycerol kinase family enzyme
VPYIGVASLGFDSDANRIANEAKLIRGNLVYLYAALRAVAGWKPATLTVAIDGEPHEVSGWSVAVANSKA